MAEMKNRWIGLYVENQVGVLAKVSGLFSGKSYNLQSLTVVFVKRSPFSPQKYQLPSVNTQPVCI